jgi:tripartite-type tricarboxylate transporter receptor subunit TctC
MLSNSIMQRLRVTLVSAAGCVWIAASASAQPTGGYPVKPVRVIVPFPAGGTLDGLTRPVAQRLSEVFRQPVIVENRPGAAGSVGTEVGARAPADGYTLTMGAPSSFASNFAVYKKLGYDPIGDFAPISNLAESPFLLAVHPSVPAHTVKEYIAFAKGRPGQVSYASFGNGSIAHLSAEQFSAIAGIKLTHVPYKGSAPGITDLIGGHVSSTIDSQFATLMHIRTGRLRPLALTMAQRSPQLPKTPTMAESGYPEIEVFGWYPMFAPVGTPREIVTRLHAEVIRALKLPEIQERIRGAGSEPVGSTPEETTHLIRREVDKWVKVARATRISVD